jgi:nitric oxide reductase subunit C
VCHHHAAVETLKDSNFEGGEFPSFGPNLTRITLTSEYLHRWLKDPPAIKPGTEMPNLHLSDDEIDALVMFLLSR